MATDMRNFFARTLRVSQPPLAKLWVLRRAARKLPPPVSQETSQFGRPGALNLEDPTAHVRIFWGTLNFPIFPDSPKPHCAGFFNCPAKRGAWR